MGTAQESHCQTMCQHQTGGSGRKMAECNKDGDRREDTGFLAGFIAQKGAMHPIYWKLSPILFEILRRCLKCITMRSALAQETEDNLIFAK